MDFSLEELTPPLLSRFWDKVIIMEDGCWEWNALYRRIRTNTGQHAIARISYAIANHKLPGNRRIVQVCGNKACIRPDHLTRGQYFSISDAITDLPISRERKRQLRKQLAGFCIRPGCHNKLVGARHCKDHLISERERQRDRNGCIERYDSMSYHL